MKSKNSQSTFPFYWADAFTDKPFKGNPAAVCIPKEPLPVQTMQSIAAELGLSETAFVWSTEKKPLKESKIFSLRWFTPKTEVKLCGHATLASAAVLFNEIKVATDQLVFETKSGKLSAKKLDEGVCLDFPVETYKPVTAEQDLLDALGIREIKDVQFSERLGMLLINVASEMALRNLQPDFECMKQVQAKVGMGVIVTSRGKPPYDFVSRFFAPQLGINEDPVTGSAHCVLTPYWSKLLNKTEMTAFQASNRGGKLNVKLTKNNRVNLIGSTYVLIKGNMCLPRKK